MPLHPTVCALAGSLAIELHVLRPELAPGKCWSLRFRRSWHMELLSTPSCGEGGQPEQRGKGA